MSPKRRHQWREAWRHVRRGARAWVRAERRDLRDAAARWFSGRPLAVRLELEGGRDDD